jgi:hypothetical protein
LQTAHRGDSQLADEVRVFAKGLLDTAPAGIAGYINDRPKRLMDAPAARFGRCHLVQPLDQIGIESRAEPDRLGEARRADGDVAVEGLVVKHHRDAQPAVLDEPSLDGVGLRGGLGRAKAGLRPAGGVAGPADLAKSIAMSKVPLSNLRIESAVGPEQLRMPLVPEARHLRNLLGDRHSTEQVGDAFGDWQRGVSVRWGFCHSAKQWISL